MIVNVMLIACIVFVCGKYAKTQALNVKAQNKTIENTFNALIERKEFAQEAQAQDKEVYIQAVKLSK